MPAHRFDEPEGMTLEEIGALFGITRQRVNRIELEAIRKLWNRRMARKKKRERKFKDYSPDLSTLGIPAYNKIAMKDIEQRAQSRGIPVSPCNEAGGNLWIGGRRCQVLSGNTVNKNGTERSVFTLYWQGKPRVDLPQVWVLVDLVNAQTWIIPEEHIKGERQLSMPTIPHPQGNYELYREAWDYLR